MKNETTRYWFTVVGKDFCIADCNGERTLLDDQGYPIDPCNDHDNVQETLEQMIDCGILVEKA